MVPQELKILGLIGARSGSKGLVDKNIRVLAGKPLMAWIIEVANKSKYVNRVIVSTDSEKYAAIARQYGAEVPHLRPSELAADDSTDFEYITYVLDWLKENENYQPDIVLRLLPTSPLQLSEDIDLCLEGLFKDSTADSAVVIAEAKQHPQKALKLVPDGQGGYYLKTYLTGSGYEVTPLLRQQHEPVYFRSNVVASRLKTIQELKSLTGDKVRCHIIPQERAIDIDSLNDFMLAEQLIKKFKNK